MSAAPRPLSELKQAIAEATDKNQQTVLEMLIQETSLHASEHAQALALSTSGWLAYLRSDRERAYRDLHAARDIYHRLGDIGGEAKCHGNLSSVFRDRGEFDRAIESAQRAIELYQQSSSVSGMASAFRLLGVGYLNLARHSEALEALGAAAEYARASDSTSLLASVHSSMAIVYEHIGRYDDAIAALNTAYEHHVKNGDVRSASVCRNNIATVQYQLGDLPGALSGFLRALELAEQAHHQHQMAACLMNIGNVYYDRGDYARSIEYCYKGLEILERIGITSELANALLNIGRTHLSAGDIDAAEGELQRGLALHLEAQYPYGLMSAHSGLASVARRRGRFQDAIDHERSAIEIARRSGAMPEVIAGEIAIAETYIAAERWDEARTAISTLEPEHIDRAETLVAYWMIKAEISIRDGDHDRAVAELQTALELAHEHEYEPVLVKIHQMYRDLAAIERDLDAYIEHNERLQSLTEKIRGEDQMRRIEMHDVERKVSEERRLLEKQRTLLLNMLPEVIADRMLQGATDLVEQYDDVSVLFLDLVNFTGLAERLSPTSLIGLLNDLFGMCDEIIARHGLTKIKTIGDAYLAVGNAPTPLADHVKATALAAHEIITGASDLFKNAHDASGLGMRIGLHTGPVIGGVVGSSRTAWDVWGDAVNIAARMEQSGEPGRIHVSAEFAKAVREAGIQVVDRGAVSVKGKGVMRTFWLDL